MVSFYGVDSRSLCEEKSLVKRPKMPMFCRQGKKILSFVSDGSLGRDAHDPVVGGFVDRFPGFGKVDDPFIDFAPGMQDPVFLVMKPTMNDNGIPGFAGDLQCRFKTFGGMVLSGSERFHFSLSPFSAIIIAPRALPTSKCDGKIAWVRSLLATSGSR